MNIEEFKKLKQDILNKLNERFILTEIAINFTNLEFEKRIDKSRLKNIIDTNLFRFNKIKEMLIKMEIDNEYLLKCYKELNDKTNNSN